jgi:hypothetical protein
MATSLALPEQRLLIFKSFTPRPYGRQLSSQFLDLTPPRLLDGRWLLAIYGHQRHHPPQPSPRQNGHEHSACARTRSLLSRATWITFRTRSNKTF